MKLRKIVTTLLVLSMLLVCLPMHTRAEEQQPTALTPMIMDRLMDVKFDPDEEVYTFADMDDIDEIIQMANENPDQYFYAECERRYNPSISHDIVIPKNLMMTWNNSLWIYRGSHVVLEGSLWCVGMNVYGTMDITETGNIYIGGHFSMYDQVRLDGTLSVRYPAEVFYENNLVYGENAYACKIATFDSGYDLLWIIQTANEDTLGWPYEVVNTSNEIEIEQPLIIPENMILTMLCQDTILYGEPLAVEGTMIVDTVGDGAIMNNLIVCSDVIVANLSGGNTGGGRMYFGGTVTIDEGSMNIFSPVTFMYGMNNLGSVDIWYDEGGYAGFDMPHMYVDTDGVRNGYLHVDSVSDSFPGLALYPMSVDDFQNVAYTNDSSVAKPRWSLGGYAPNHGPHEHLIVTADAVEPSCLAGGSTGSERCVTCGEVYSQPEVLPPQGHNYGVDADGNPDFWDTTCDVCGAERVVDKHRPTHSMYRMYNPNSGEHFYTGSMVERQNLEAAGWKYEGVGFTFPATTGKPVYRLYDRDNTHEHLYTMDEAEKDQLLAEGWILEGVAFNSGREDEVPQYRLHNPNATIGAYHFTASVEEKDALIAAGWDYQGIGFYTCLQ